MTPRIQYVEKNFHDSTLRTIAQAREIIGEYAEQGYDLTLRQLYYQFVARDLIPNEQKEYNRLGRIVSDARLAGLIDWHAIEDRTRNLQSARHWENPSQIIRAASRWYREDRWSYQPIRVEVWIEKEALSGVFAGTCNELDVPYIACRGYMSQSEMWSAADRLRDYVVEDGQELLILHFGDHDPSGIDMTRDIRDRLGMFLTGEEDARAVELEVRRVALNMAQIEEHQPPPNPAKFSDSRYEGYVRNHGRQSWELDALEPALLTELVREHVQAVRDDEAWVEAEAREEGVRATLRHVASDLSESGDSP